MQSSAAQLPSSVQTRQPTRRCTSTPRSVASCTNKRNTSHQQASRNIRNVGHQPVWRLQRLTSSRKQALTASIVTALYASSASDEPTQALVRGGAPSRPDLDTPLTGRDLLSWLSDLPWGRVAIWATVAFFAMQLKDFFGIAMGTFVLSFIGNGFVNTAQKSMMFEQLAPSTRRHLLVLAYFTSIVSLVTLFGVLTIPDIIREAADFVQRLQSDNVWVVVLDKMRHGLGGGVMDQVERFLMVASGDDLANALGGYAQEWTPERTAYLGLVLQRMLRGYTDAAVALTSDIVTFASRFAIQVGVSMVLSFMVVWDLPAIRRGMSSLETSRLAPMYREVAPNFAVFGQLFGKALQAQARIALVNCALTAMGMWILRIPGIGLLSLFVFICSFIPIAGCFISTVPIAFVALTEYGFLKLALVILMVTLIHFVEAYGLNPAIYSAHLKLHPLLVLTVLVVAEHSLGVWGLLLAVPLTVFLRDYCISYPSCSVTDVAAKELETVCIADFAPVEPERGSGDGRDFGRPYRPPQVIAQYE